MSYQMTTGVARRGLPGTADVLFVALFAAVGMLPATRVCAEEGLAAAMPLTIEVVNVETDEGTIMVQVFATEEAFKSGDPAAAALMVAAQPPVVSFSIDALPAGEYGIRVMHDVDGDGALKTGMMGMPQEPWGMSNDARGRFGPPSWSQVKFLHPDAGPQTITLR